MDFDLSKAVEMIKKQGAEYIAIQVPEGLRHKALEIANYLEKETNTKVLIWAGSCYGACDIPVSLRNLNVKFLIHIGHEMMNL